jgi:hypothetical protein
MTKLNWSQTCIKKLNLYLPSILSLFRIHDKVTIMCIYKWGKIPRNKNFSLLQCVKHHTNAEHALQATCSLSPVQWCINIHRPLQTVWILLSLIRPGVLKEQNRECWNHSWLSLQLIFIWTPRLPYPEHKDSVLHPKQHDLCPSEIQIG